MAFTDYPSFLGNPSSSHTDSPLRLGIAGLGSMGRNHLRVASRLDGVVCAAALEVDTGLAVGTTGVDVLTDSAVFAGMVDAAIVAVPTEEHLVVARELILEGVHVLVEKPLAHSVDAAEELVRCADEIGVVLAVGHIERFNPAVLELRRRLENDELGEIFQIATSRQGPFPDRIRDVGVIKDLASHDIDVVQFICQSPYASVAAFTAHRAGRPHEDLVSAVARLANGTVVNHMVNWLSPEKERRVTITGERGRFIADTLSGDLTFFANGVVKTEWEHLMQFRGVSEGDMTRFPKREPLRAELEGFRDAILGRESGAIVSGLEGVGVLRVAEAIDRASRNASIEDLQ